MLYEVLAGRRPFAGTTELEVLQTVLHGTAAPLGPEIPLPVRMIVEKALEKDAADRYQSMRDLVVDLRRAARRQPEASGTVAPAAETARRPRWNRFALGAVAGALIALAGALGARWLRMAPSAVPSSDARFLRITDSPGMEEMPAVSPDGRTVAFVAPVDGRRQIWIRLLAGGASLRLTHNHVDHDHPRWSPDSSAIVYFTPPTKEGESGTLWEIPALGGAARRLAASITGADLSHDGRRVAAFEKVGNGVALAILDETE